MAISSITKDTPNSKVERIMNGVAKWCSYYRSNPHRFAKDYLNINLKLFQKIILFMMNIMNYSMYISSRSQGKTYLIAIFSVIRCILYPGTKIVVASSNRKQAAEIIGKIIKELMPNSDNLKLEILNYTDTAIKSEINFKNGSFIKVVTANDGARGNRANILIIDEFRLVDEYILINVLQKFNGATRHPKYLDKPEYAHLQERNKEIYASSAWFKSSWAYNKMMSYATNMLDDRKGYFLCGLPYHLSIAEGLYLKEEAEDKMSESTFNEISWNMEMAAMWFGENENSFFLYDELKNSRKIKECTYPRNMYDYIKDNKFSYKEVSKRDNNIRIIVADIAIMGGRKNDSTSIFVIELVPIKNREQYYRNVIYTDAWEGGHSETQAIKIRRLYEQFECSYLVIDGAGVGAGVFDALVKDLVDDETQETYPAITCFNDDAMAERCKYPNADRVIFSIKANNKFNTECAMSLRDCIKRGKTRILIDEVEAEEYFIEKYKKAFYDLSPENKAKIMMPYVNTSLLINEMINLEQATTPNSGDIKLIEKSGARKDRYSALSYGNYFANLLERKIAKPTGNILDKFKMRAPVRSTNQQAVGW